MQQVRHHDVHRGFAVERRLMRQHFEQHDAKRIDVGAMIDANPARLFGRHIAWRTHHRPGAGAFELRIGATEFRDAEVEQLNNRRFTVDVMQENIFRL